MSDPARVVAPGGTIGIVGGGQLGRMTALAAARLGYRCHILCPEPDSPAAQVAARATVAPYEDEAALDRFAASVDVITYEFENLPVAAFARMERFAPVRPHWRCLEVTQDRGDEKDFLAAQGLATAAWRRVSSADSLEAALEELGRPAVLKTARLGYDGKGQVRIGAHDHVQGIWQEWGFSNGLLEAFVAFEQEISALAARGLDGTVRCFDIVSNQHRDHILARTRAPAAVPDSLAEAARETACKLSRSLDLVGLLAVEMFVTADGRLLVNELAARPHNSGHWTIDACATSQFEQFVRAVAGLPLGDPRRHSDAVMENLLGDAAGDWPDLLAEPGAKLHLYGKTGMRPGRKMGHVTRLVPSPRAR